MIKKNVFKTLGVGVLVLSLYACGGGETSTDNTSKSTSTEINDDIIEVIQEASSTASVGEDIYKKTCLACHQADGKGIEGAFPPLAGSDYLLEDVDRAIKQVIEGSEGEITVNGTVYSGVMPPQILENQEIVDVINYVLNSWGNDGGKVTIEDVQAQKSAG